MRKDLALATTLACVGASLFLLFLFPAPTPPPLSESAPLETDSSSPDVSEEKLDVLHGETITQILAGRGITIRQCNAAVEALSEQFSPKDLQVGQQLFIRIKTNKDSTIELLRLMIRPSIEREVVVSLKEDGGYQAALVEKKLAYETKRSHGIISSSLYADASKAGIPAQVICELTQGLSYSIHLQKDIQQHDPFEVIYENAVDKETGLQKPGRLVYAAIGVHGEPHEIFSFTTLDGRTDLYDSRGESVRRALLMTPVVAAKLSSPYGMRRHPIQGYSKMHKGVDFAAPRGTAVMAAGDGTITFAGRRGGYGNYVMINHHNGYNTVYAHLSKFGRAIKKGTRIQQGQIIGFVGSTGNSTGPHLHHEVIYQGRHVDPQKVRQPAKTKLTSQELKNFLKFKQKIKRQTRGLMFKGRYVQGTPAAMAGASNANRPSAFDRQTS